VLVCPVQTGKTEALFDLIGHSLEKIPRPMISSRAEEARPNTLRRTGTMFFLLLEFLTQRGKSN
jgi:hypothetical protein